MKPVFAMLKTDYSLKLLWRPKQSWQHLFAKIGKLIKKSVTNIVIAMLATGGMSVANAKDNAATADLRKAMTMTMRHFYSNRFDLDRQCFLYELQQNQFCMQIVKADVKAIGQSLFLFLVASSDLSEETAGHASSGLGGLFVLQQFGTTWQVVSSLPIINNGQWGESQLKDFKLTQIGPQQYGWVGEFGGSGAGGETNTDWVIFAPVGNTIKEVAREETYHSYTGSQWQSVEGSVSILNQQKPVNGFYPLQVTRTTQTAPVDADLTPIKSKVKTKNQHYQLFFYPKKSSFDIK